MRKQKTPHRESPAAGFHQIIKAPPALFVAGRFVGACVTRKAEDVFVDDDVDVFGEALDQAPGFGKRGATLEGQVFADVRQVEYFAQRPANPEILVHAGGLQALCVGHGEAGQTAIAGVHAQVGVHGSAGKPTHDFANPAGRVAEVFEQLRLILWRELPLDNGEHFVVYVALADMPKCLNDGAAFAACGRHVARCGAF